MYTAPGSHNAAVNVFPDPPHRGAAWGLPSATVIYVQGDGRGCRGVSHVQGNVRGVSHVQGEGRGVGASAIFNPMGRVRGVSHVQGDGGEGRQSCSR